MLEEGRLDVFFANAGIATAHHVSELGSDEFMRTLKINVLSYVFNQDQSARS